MGCIVKTSFYTRLVMTTVGPILISVGIFLWAAVSRKKARSGKRRREIVDSAVGSFLWLTYFVFVSVSTTIFFTFGCVKFGDDPTSYLVVDVSINCDSTEHKVYMAYASLMIVVYPLGISLLYSKLLWDNRVAIKDEENRDGNEHLNKFAFLWDSYKANLWWFEIFECVKRQFLTGMLVFISAGSASQITFAIFLSVTSLALICYKRPFLEEENNHLSIASHISIFCTLFASLLVRVNVDDDDDYDQTVFGYLLVVINLLGIFMVVIGTVLKPVRKALGVGKKGDKGDKGDGSEKEQPRESSFFDVFSGGRTKAKSWFYKKKLKNRAEGFGEDDAELGVELGEVYKDDGGVIATAFNPMAEHANDTGLLQFTKGGKTMKRKTGSGKKKPSEADAGIELIDVNRSELPKSSKPQLIPPPKKTSADGKLPPPPIYDSDDDVAPPPSNKLWDVHHSEEHHADYYVNKENGETVWERPPGV